MYLDIGYNRRSKGSVGQQKRYQTAAVTAGTNRTEIPVQEANKPMEKRQNETNSQQYGVGESGNPIPGEAKHTNPNNRLN